MTRPSPANLAIIRRDCKYNGSVALSVLGMDRWSLRVTAYAGLMTDTYPPFRLDQGGTDPGSVPARSARSPAPSASPSRASPSNSRLRPASNVGASA